MKTKETSSQCRVCGGEGKPSTALVNEVVYFDDFGGDAGQRGSTGSRVGVAKPTSCIKCTSCGHSWVPLESSTREQALVWWKQLCLSCELDDTHYVLDNLMRKHIGFERRYHSLTGREIEEIWKKEVNGAKVSAIMGYDKPNQKQFKQFDKELFKKYIDKFSLADRFDLVALSLLTLNLSINDLTVITNILVKAEKKEEEF